MKYIVLIVCMLSVCFCSGCTANSTKPPTAAQDTKAATMTLPSGQIPSVQLNSGYSMPMLGLGTWTLRDEICENAVYTAIQCGYRLIDTARYYGNERAVGKGIQKAIPLGGRGNIKKVLGNKTIDEIARRHGKTPAQIILRWQLQAGYVVIPGSLNPAHIAENANIFDFELTEAEMREMMHLNRQERFENW